MYTSVICDYSLSFLNTYTGSASGAAPVGFASASPGNAFMTVSKPAASTAPTIAAAPSKPVPTQSTEAAKQPQPFAPKGPPNAVAPGGTSGLTFGAPSSVPKGPPNAVAPASSGLFQQGQPGRQSQGPPNAVAPGSSSGAIGFGPPNAVAPGPKAAVAPSITKGAAQELFKAPSQSQSVAPVSAAAAAPKATGVAPGPPNAVAPSVRQGLPSYKDATAAQAAAVPQGVTKTPVAKAVGVAQPTPKVPSGGLDPSGITAASTPAVTAKPVTDALLSNIREEVNKQTRNIAL